MPDLYENKTIFWKWQPKETSVKSGLWDFRREPVAQLGWEPSCISEISVLCFICWSVVLKSQGVLGQWHLSAYKFNYRKGKNLTRNLWLPVPQSHWGVIRSLFGPATVPFVLPSFLLQNAPALIQKCCHSVHTKEISGAWALNFYLIPPFVLPLAFLYAWKYCGFSVQSGFLPPKT